MRARAPALPPDACARMSQEHQRTASALGHCQQAKAHAVSGACASLMLLRTRQALRVPVCGVSAQTPFPASTRSANAQLQCPNAFGMPERTPHPAPAR
eukprot:5126804-Alexandrium_andersonii.AAC.1